MPDDKLQTEVYELVATPELKSIMSLIPTKSTVSEHDKRAYLQGVGRIPVLEASATGAAIAVIVRNTEDLLAAETSFSTCKKLRKQEAAAFALIKKELTALLKRIRDAEKMVDRPWAADQAMLGSAIQAWRRAEEEKVRREAARLAQIEADRLVAEREAEAERLRQEAAAAATKTRTRELERKARKVEKTEVSTAGAVEAAVEKTRRTASRMSSVRTVTRWSANVVDLMSLVKQVARGKAPLSYLQANQVALNQLARGQKKIDLGLDGVEGVAKSESV